MITHSKCNAMTKTQMYKIINSDFVKNTATLMSGNVFAQMIAVGVAPVLTRLFTPENFGLFALFTATVGLTAKISSFCYERAILLPKEDEEAISVFFLCLLLVTLVTTLTLVLILLFMEKIAHHLAMPDFAFWILFVPIGVFFQSIKKILTFWRLRYKEFKFIAVAKSFESVTSATTKIFVGLIIGAYAGGLIGGAILGTVVCFVLLFMKPNRFDFRQKFKCISLDSIIRAAKVYKQFPYFATWNVALNTLSQNIVIFMLSFLFTPAVVGFYSLGSRVLREPIILLSESVQNVYFQKAAQQYAHEHSLLTGYKKTTLILFLLGLLPFGLLITYGKILFDFVFGLEWETAGYYVQILSPWFFLLFVSGPSNIIYEVCQKQDLKLIISVSKLILRVLALACGYFLIKSVAGILMIFCVVNVVIEIVSIVIAFRIAKRTVT